MLTIVCQLNNLNASKQMRVSLEWRLHNPGITCVSFGDWRRSFCQESVVERIEGLQERGLRAQRRDREYTTSAKQIKGY